MVVGGRETLGVVVGGRDAVGANVDVLEAVGLAVLEGLFVGDFKGVADGDRLLDGLAMGVDVLEGVGIADLVGDGAVVPPGFEPAKVHWDKSTNDVDLRRKSCC